MEKVLTLQATIFLLVAVGFMLKRIGLIGPQGQKKPERSCYLCDSALQHSSCIYEQSCGGQTIVLSGGPSDLCRDSDFLRVLWKADLQEGTRGEK